MTQHKVGTQEEWEAAGGELLAEDLARLGRLLGYRTA